MTKIEKSIVDLRERTKDIKLSPNGLDHLINSIDQLIIYIKEHHDEYVSLVSLRFHRKWIKAHLHYTKKKLLKAKSLLATKDIVGFNDQIMIAEMSVGHCVTMLEVRGVMKGAVNGDINDYKINLKDIKKGDVILEYKTWAYLRSNPLSWLISIATSSQVTHSSIVCEESETEPYLLTASDATHGLGVEKIDPHHGEIFAIFRLKDGLGKREELQNVVDSWKTRAVYQKFRREKKYKFGEFKLQMACLVGGMYTLCIKLFQISVVWKNPASNRPGVYCSEVIDLMFKEIGLLLVNRSEHASLAGPIEIFFSPHLEFKGLVCHDEDLPIFKAELSKIC